MRSAAHLISFGLWLGLFPQETLRAPTTARNMPATAPATRPVLQAVDLRYSVYLARVEIHISISREGVLRRVKTENKSWGPEDKTVERVEKAQGQLTAKQIMEVARSFDGWNALSGEPYGGVADSPEIVVRYGDKTVSGGSETPKQVWDAYSQIKEFVKSLPRVEE